MQNNAFYIPFRHRGNAANGLGFTQAMKQAVWNKATAIPGLSPAVWRQDACGARMYWPDYGRTIERGFGWEIDHIDPVANGGSDSLGNLQALQWQNNRHKGDTVGTYTCAMRYSN